MANNSRSSSSPLNPQRSENAAPSSPSSLALPTPPPVPVETHPNRGGLKPRTLLPSPDPSRLSPEDAFSPPRLRAGNIPSSASNTYHSLLLSRVVATPPAVAALRPPPAVPGLEPKNVRDRSRRRKKKGQWKKLLWVKQSYPDNYTDTETFLDHLQRNPRLQPYDFWPLIADFTVIVQHVCSVVIFVCCFAVIFQERVSPVSIVSCGSIWTILGWILWDSWVRKEELEAARLISSSVASIAGDHLSPAGSNLDSNDNKQTSSSGLGLTLEVASIGSLPSQTSSQSGRRSNSTSATSIGSSDSADSSPPEASSDVPDCTLSPPSNTSCKNMAGVTTPSSFTYNLSSHSFVSSRNRQLLSTAKSSFLIFCTLRGLSPILKSLTKSTASDSIWAMSCWLLVINIFFFDYGSGEKNSASGATAANFPASLSTNAALMASTVLASRLKSTTHVFSLTLFSIQVFGLFPVFRRHLRTFSWEGHVTLTVALVVIASAGVGITLKGGFSGTIIGILVGCPSTALAMGICSWWLIGLQRYKNVVIGPWDPAKPIIRRQWD
ncbi:hypothetical protein FQN57_005079 [Myotisia sp. PD_48]|nr:hypothetical protein FQN57_005079 [Myotisia sp. PD_48]